jgi:hypothetical protein
MWAVSFSVNLSQTSWDVVNPNIMTSLVDDVLLVGEAVASERKDSLLAAYS